eukprot:TRINITY_DN3245_c0_g2_i3.p1 TRINITY_DN3245_c0_g2~~TRINITY_DN3245_c0_g2_i3.p1  ORF type:complete len:323 (+),score=55.45 TRINITY_DN3245_c0_g2_i3:1648-2616(+)
MQDSRGQADSDSESSSSSSTTSSSSSSSSSNSSSSSELSEDAAVWEYEYRAFQGYLLSLCKLIPGLEKYGSGGGSRQLEVDVKIRRDLLCEGSTWSKSFLGVLNKYSEIEVGRKLDEKEELKCQACGRKASYLLFLSGIAYDANELWDTSDPAVYKKTVETMKTWSSVVPRDGLVPVGPGCKEAALCYHKLHHLKLDFITKLVRGISFRKLFVSYQDTLSAIERKFLEGDVVPSPGQELITRWLKTRPKPPNAFLAAQKKKKSAKKFVPPMAGSLDQRNIRSMLKPKEGGGDIIKLGKRKQEEEKKELQQGTLRSFFKKQKK